MLVLFVSKALAKNHGNLTYLLLGVSGTLQDGFPLRNRLDYIALDGTKYPARFVGKALVPGYKAYLDIKEEGWREYVDEPKPPQIPNAVVIPTGCREHANIYWVYLVPSPQFLRAFMGEPRFLSITPDTGLVDLDASETDDRFKEFALQEIQKSGKNDTSRVAIPLVTGSYFHDSYIESPTAYEKEDGTLITTYADGLALWANVSLDDLLAPLSDEHPLLKETAWAKVHKAIRQAEIDGPKIIARPESFECKEQTRFGVSHEQARLNYPFYEERMKELFDDFCTSYS